MEPSCGENPEDPALEVRKEDSLSDLFEIEGLEDTRKSIVEEFVLCKICSNTYNNPRILSCLHVFCEGCLDKRLLEGSAVPDQIVCPECQQETMVPKGAGSLPLDFVSANKLTSPAPGSLCTNCDSGGMPMSWCYECARYICAYCYQAHQTMRCFKDHNVVKFNKDGNSSMEPLHLPVFCQVHSSERVTLFCTECKVLVCKECLSTNHWSHLTACKRVHDIAPQAKEELEKLVSETMKMSGVSAELLSSLDNVFSELHRQSAYAEELVQHAYTLFKNVLKNCRDHRLKEIKTLTTDRELKILEDRQLLEKFGGKIEHACRFSAQLLENGNAAEILALKNVVSARLASLVEQPPRVDLKCNMQFGSTVAVFQRALQGFQKPIQPANDQKASLGQQIQQNLKDPSVDREGTGKDERIHSQEAIWPCRTGQLSDKDIVVEASRFIRSSADREDQAVEIEGVFKFGTMGSAEGEFNSPHDFCVNRNGDIIVADTGNHRIQIFDKNGVFKSKFGTPGTEIGQLLYPLMIAVFRSTGNLVICDMYSKRSRLQVFSANGTPLNLIHSGQKSGFAILNGLSVTKNSNIVAVNSDTVFVVSKAGEPLMHFCCRKYVDAPSAIIFRGNEFYVCDYRGQAVVVFSKDGIFEGRISRETDSEWRPTGIDITEKGTIIVADAHGKHFRHVAFDSSKRELYSAECRDYKVWRAGGLEVTSEGFIISIARYENSILVMRKL